MRQDGDYKKAVQLLSEGKTDEGFDELARLGWVQEVPDEERYLRLAEAYLAASAEKKADGSLKKPWWCRRRTPKEIASPR